MDSDTDSAITLIWHDKTKVTAQAAPLFEINVHISWAACSGTACFSGWVCLVFCLRGFSEQKSGHAPFLMYIVFLHYGIFYHINRLLAEFGV